MALYLPNQAESMCGLIYTSVAVRLLCIHKSLASRSASILLQIMIVTIILIMFEMQMQPAALFHNYVCMTCLKYMCFLIYDSFSEF